MRNVKVAMFSILNDLQKVNDTIGEFIKDKNIIDIKYQPISFISEQKLNIVEKILIIYKEKQ